MQYNSEEGTISKYLKSFLTKISYHGFNIPYIPLYYEYLLLHNKFTNVVYRLQVYRLKLCNVVPTFIPIRVSSIWSHVLNKQRQSATMVTIQITS